MRDKRPILLVENDPVDQQGIKRAFEVLHIRNSLVVANNGEEGLAYLRDSRKDQPCLIFLDLKTPRMNGIEFLKVVKADDRLKGIPVLVFTTSDEERDRVESFKLGVAGYIVKPSDHRKVVDIIHTLDLYWTLSELPPPV